MKTYGGRLDQTDPKKKAEFEAELNRLMRFINKDSSVLDIGAGYGRLAIPLARHVRKMTVVEPAHPFMNQLKSECQARGGRQHRVRRRPLVRLSSAREVRPGLQHLEFSCLRPRHPD
ncbi:MAG: hypothetical protein A4E48_00064 [Methanosaeta sp. PtaU1.Bin060]|nr:MAG: hypothetical protein A4E48_00064 [Methanosaeta sp. PtaU1.Bin060]